MAVDIWPQNFFYLEGHFLFMLIFMTLSDLDLLSLVYQYALFEDYGQMKEWNF